MSDQSLVRRDQLPLARPFVAPRTETERVLAEIWARVLDMDHVGTDDDYTDLGGDSLLATTMFALITARFGIELSVTILAEASTVGRLAAHIDGLPSARVTCDVR